MKYNAILLFGAPGSGKGTQGKVLGNVPNYYHCACGDVFRNLTVESELGRTFIDFSARGELVPDEYTVKLWKQYMDSRKQTGQFQPDKDYLVLDGIPRNIKQAQMLNESLIVKGVFSLVCIDRSKLVHRLQRRALRDNRLDDANLDVIMNRLDTYERESKPVLKYYGDSLVHTIDATQPPIKVLHAILTKLTLII